MRVGRFDLGAAPASLAVVLLNSSAQSFKKKTVEVFVPARAGGGLTRNAQRFTKNLVKAYTEQSNRGDK